MPQYKVIHGSIKLGGKFHGPGKVDDDGAPLDVVELPEKEAALMDPSGACLVLKSKWDVAQAGEKAKAEAIKKAEAEITKKGGGK